MSRMSLTKRQANYIWYCIKKASGVKNNVADLCLSNGITMDEMVEFERFVQNAIESIKVEP